MSSVVAFKSLSTSMIGLLDTFDGLCDKVLAEHNDKARDLTKLCYNLHQDFYDHMVNVSSVCLESSNTIRGIQTDLTIAKRNQKFDRETSADIKESVKSLSAIVKKHKRQTGDINSKIVETQESVGRAQVSLAADRPKFKFLEKINTRETLEFLGAIPGVDSNIVFVFGQAIIGAVAVAINGIYSLINRKKTKRYDVISEVLKELSQKLKELLAVSFKFHQSLDKTLTNLESYTALVDKLVKYSDSERHNTRLVIMAEDMLPDTEELQKDFQGIREQALVNNSDLGRAILRLSPRSLIGI
ncbi:hypothetical protein BDF21DRAFT_476296 [Thamnidium elegans]|uniref:Uncharacterized protein n=1 Tax=Thamnidium elegans TaxID=101142 RepID=A0A8H7SWS9_9FUNG|nr:hypothetical protein INT48_002058 [Thamnidium elegans]KAI8094392.1 hypothetical protein BDF21DRAFT_476296 [Thamnidium elegans]